MNFRKMLFWSHLIAGCIGGVVILLMSLTGVILTYERQILASVERGQFQTQASGQKLGAEELVAKVSEQRDLASGTMLTLRSNPTDPAEIGGGRDGVLYVNAYTGLVLGNPSATKWRAFFQQVTAWHRWIGMEGEGRTLAKTITGACNLAFLGIVVSGAYLWLPKKFSKQHLRRISWFKGGLSGKARDFNWHNTIGVWFLVPLFFVVLSAVPMSYTWANDLIYTMTGSEVPVAATKGGEKGKAKGKQGPMAEGRGPGGGERREPTASSYDLTGVNSLWQKAESQVPDWTSISLRLPDSGSRTAVFTIDTGDGGQPQKLSTLTLNRETGEKVKWETFFEASTGRQIRSYSRFLHTGEAMGIVGQTIAGLASLGGVVLVWTGISLALRRFAAWRERKKRRVEEFAATASVG